MPNQLGKQLFEACQLGELKKVQVLLRRSKKVLKWKNPDEKHQSALHAAINSGYKEIVKYLLKLNASVLMQDENGWRPIHYASSIGRNDIIDMLLKQNPKHVHSQTKKGDTALHIACKNGHAETVKLFLKKGISSDAPNKKKLSPLKIAVYSKQHECVKAILEFENGAEDTDKDAPKTSKRMTRVWRRNSQQSLRLSRVEPEKSRLPKLPDITLKKPPQVQDVYFLLRTEISAMWNEDVKELQMSSDFCTSLLQNGALGDGSKLKTDLTVCIKEETDAVMILRALEPLARIDLAKKIKKVFQHQRIYRKCRQRKGIAL